MPNGTPQQPISPTGKPFTPPQPMRPGVPNAAPVAPAPMPGKPFIRPAAARPQMRPPKPMRPGKVPKGPKAPKKGRGGLITLIIILIIVVLGGGGFAAWYYDLIPGFSRTPDSATEVSAPSLTDETTTTADTDIETPAIEEEVTTDEETTTTDEDVTTIETPVVTAPLSSDLYNFGVLSSEEYRRLRTFGAYPLTISPDDLGQDNLFKPFF
ncbi:hypothetical protein ACFL1U_00680 [Patescibacteria group bacterium]